MGHLLLVPCSSDGDDVAVAEGREKRKRGKEEGMTYVILGWGHQREREREMVFDSVYS